MRLGGGGVNAEAGWLLLNRACLQRGEFRQAADRLPELLGQVAVAGDAVALAAVERVLAAPGAQDHFRMVEEVAIDRNLDALDGKRRDAQAIRDRRGAAGSPAARLRRNTMSVTTAVPSRLKASEGRRIAPTKSALRGQVLADGGILLVEREMRRDQGQHAAGLQGVDGLGEEEVVQRTASARDSRA